ncbi:MAG: hypothetical protein ACO3OX_03450 [Burkholderiaceae bacterium]
MSELQQPFVADLRRAADGLAHAQASGLAVEAMAVSMYVRDIADALYCLRLTRHAELAERLARQATSGFPNLQDLFVVFSQLVAELLQALEGGDFDAATSLGPEHHQQLARLAAELSGQGEAAIDLSGLAYRATDQLPDPMIQQADAQVTHGDSDDIDLSDMQGLVYFQGNSNDLVESDNAQAAAADANDAASPGLSIYDRTRGLQRLQAMAQFLGDSGSDELARRGQLMLADHADWMVGIGQELLAKRLYGLSRTLDLGDLRADSDVVDYLVAMLGQLPQPSKITGSVQSQTLFIELADIPANAPALERINQAMQVVNGRLQPVDNGLWMILPKSLSRLRVVPFMRGGQRYAISWAQFLSAETCTKPRGVDLLGEVDAPRLRIHGQSGAEPFVLYADAVLPFTVANAFVLPQVVAAPEWVAGVLVGEDAQLMSWLIPT